MWVRSRRSPRSVTLAYSPLSRKGKTRCGSRPRPPRRGKEKVCYVQCCGGNLQPLTLTNSTQFLQALKGRLSIGHLSSPSVASARTSSRCWRSFSGDRSTAENSICGRTASSRSLTQLVVTSGLLAPRGTRVPPTTDQRDLCTQQCRTANSLS